MGTKVSKISLPEEVQYKLTTISSTTPWAKDKVAKGNIISNPIEVGKGFMFDDFYKGWFTSPIVEIELGEGNTLTFTTQNSIYKLEETDSYILNDLLGSMPKVKPQDRK